MKIALTALATAALCFGVTATAGLASHRSARLGGTVIKIGQYLQFPALDLSCLYPAKDPGGKERGAVLYCTRASDHNPDDKPATVEISKYHFKVSDTGASSWTTTVWRHP